MFYEQKKLEIFFDSLKSENLLKDKRNFEKKNSHIRHKSQNISKKSNDLNIENVENLINQNDEEQKIDNNKHQPLISFPQHNPKTKILPNIFTNQKSNFNSINENVENPSVNLENMMQILHQERLYEMYRNKQKEKEGATSFQINRLPERKIDLHFIQSHSKIDKDYVTYFF